MKKTLVLILLVVIIPSLAFASEVILKSGQKMEGKIVEQTDKYVKIDSGIGVPTTYYFDEVDTVDGKPVAVPESATVSPTKTQDTNETDLKQKAQVAPTIENTTKEFTQQDGLFKLNLPDGWRGQEMSGRVIILPPPPKGNGIVIQYKPDTGAGNPETIKNKISESLNNIAEYKVKPIGGNVIENKEIMIDNIPAQYLLYNVSLKGEGMYFVRVMFDNKGYIFSIDYGDGNKSEVDKVINLLNTWKF